MENLDLPLTFVHPFTLFYSDGEFTVFWATSKEDYTMWTEAFRQILPPETENKDKYGVISNNNKFLGALYESLEPGQGLANADQYKNNLQMQGSVQGKMHECVQMVAENEPLFRERHFRLDLKTMCLSVFDIKAVELIEEVFLTGRVKKVLTDLMPSLGEDDMRTE